MKTLRHGWIRLVEFFFNPLARVDFDEKDVPIVTYTLYQ